MRRRGGRGLEGVLRGRREGFFFLRGPFESGCVARGEFWFAVLGSEKRGLADRSVATLVPLELRDGIGKM